MAALPTCLVALVVALGFLFVRQCSAARTTAGVSVEQRQEVESLLRRLNKPPLATIEVDGFKRNKPCV